MVRLKGISAFMILCLVFFFTGGVEAASIFGVDISTTLSNLPDSVEYIGQDRAKSNIKWVFYDVEVDVEYFFAIDGRIIGLQINSEGKETYDLFKDSLSRDYGEPTYFQDNYLWYFQSGDVKGVGLQYTEGRAWITFHFYEPDKVVSVDDGYIILD